MSSLLEIVEALATALEPLRDELEDVQIYPYMVKNATPPTIDIYPGDPFQTGLTFGNGNSACYFTIRARAGTADQDAGQRVLLELLDDEGPTSLGAALVKDQSLGGRVDSLGIVEDGVSGYREYPDGAGSYLGCEWRVEVYK